MANAGLWESVNPPILPEIISIIHQKFGFKTMTPVQAATLPKFLENKDVAVEVQHT
jgi:ATP-dependent RNA helicase DDX55/SPB4